VEDGDLLPASPKDAIFDTPVLESFLSVLRDATIITGMATIIT
jgi:hypothetical protein